MKYLFIFLFSFQIFAQSELSRFEKISAKNNISQTSVTCGIQTRNGFLWFGTQDGLNRYDGKSFKTYRNIPFNKNSLPDNWVQCLYEDSDSNLWIGTHAGGISLFNENDESFTNLFSNNKLPENLRSNILWTISENENNIFAGTGYGVYSINKKTRKINYLKIKGANISPEFFPAVNAIHSDDKFLWLGTWGNGLVKMDISGNSARIFSFSETNNNRNPDKIKVIKEINGKFYLGTSNGIYIFDKKTETAEKISLVPNELNNEPVYSLCRDSKGNIWVGTHHNGVFLLNETTGFFRNFSYERNNPNGISDNWVMSVFEDKSGVMWFGTGSGICKLVPSKHKFRNYNYFTTNSSFGDFEVKCTYQDSKNNIWLGTWNEGIFLFDSKTGNFKNIKKTITNGLQSNTIWKVFEDKQGIYWIGTYNGLFVYDIKTQNFSTVRTPDSNKNLLINTNISDIFEDSYGLIWIGTWGNGLFSYNKSTGEYKNYKHLYNNSNSISSNLITTICEDKHKNLWIGTGGGGMNLFTSNSGYFTRFISEGENPNSISNNYVKCIYTDSSDILWIGSWGGGITRYDIKNKKFKHFTEQQGLANNMVFGILEDSNKNLWISTNGGISKFNKETEKIINYTAEDGLANNQFSNGYYKLENGDFIFGGTQGFTIFNPDSIKINKTAPELELTSFKIFNEPLDPERYLCKKEVELNYQENYFSLDFAVLEFTSPEKNSIMYKLDGLDNNWILNGNKSEIQYTNLYPGKYVLRVKAANSDNIWNKKEYRLLINVIPPFWLTKWFVALVFIIILLIIIVVYKYRVNIIQRQNRRLEQLVNERTTEIQNEIYTHQITEKKLQEIVETRDKFFSIIAHDLRSPFTSILGHAEWLKEEFESFSPAEMKESVVKIYDGLKKLFGLTEDLLEWSRIQLGKIEFSQIDFSIKEAVEDVITMVHFYTKSKNISISNNIKNDIRVYADRRMIQTAMQNIITSSIKFSKEYGSIKISATNYGDYAEIEISDDGIGLSEESIENLFRVDVRHTTLGTANEKGSGLGLIISKELISKNNGTIKVESEPAKGTKFMFTLPLANN